MIRRSGLTAFLAAIAASVIGVAPAAAVTGPGCEAGQAGVAHYAGGVTADPQPAGAPTPCGMQTGFGGGESAIAVTNSGAVLYAPAVQASAGVQAQYFLGGNSAFARTIDAGESWQFVNPLGLSTSFLPAVSGPPVSRFSGSLGYPAWDQIDDKFYVDRTTGRLFWTDPDVPSEAVLRSDDGGASWGVSELPLGLGGEWTQVTTGRPVMSHPSGYPEVVYACGEYDSVARDITTQLEGDICQKSLDGGTTWQAAGQGFFGSPVAPHAACDSQSEHPNFSPWAAPDAQGRLYELLFCAGRTYLIRSSDEGATWPIYAQVPFGLANVGPGNTGNAELRTDAEGNLYLAWSDPGNPNPNGSYAPGTVYLAVSRDGGLSWGPRMAVLAPGVSGIFTHFGFDVGRPGQVAISYLGTRAGRGGFDGYITYTTDALASRPLFWSAAVNPLSAQPLDAGGKGSSGGLGLDYVSVSIGPDGTPWASFWDACGNNVPQPNPSCPPSRSQSTALRLGYMDYAGRLLFGPASEPSGRTCPAPTGRVRGSVLGRIALGLTRSAARARAGLSRLTGVRPGVVDVFCLRGGDLRAVYPSPALLRVLGRSSRRAVRGRVVALLSANPRYALAGVRPGERLTAARWRLRLGPGFRLGHTTWYVIPSRAGRGVVEVRNGVVVEVGVVSRRATPTPRAMRRLLSSVG